MTFEETFDAYRANLDRLAAERAARARLLEPDAHPFVADEMDAELAVALLTGTAALLSMIEVCCRPRC
ncbi:MAG: hypothetical protein DDT34_02101 [Firmicutes bacterium]|nr:hypothetical protein [Bacillota bacterium]